MPASEAAAIVLVVHDFSGGGSERVAIRLAGRWAASGRAVTIVCGTEAGPLRSIVGAGVRVRAVQPRVVRAPLSRFRLGRAVAQALEDTPADVVVGPGNFHVPVLRAIGPTSPPIVCKISNPLRRGGRSAGGQWLFDRAFAAATRHFGALVTMSPSLAAEARTALGRADIACIAEPNVADDWSPTPRVRRDGPARIVCAGRLVSQKNFALAVRTMAAMRGDWRLDLLGDGPEAGALAGVAAELGLTSRVNFAGHVADIAPYLAGADAFLCTSRFEGYPAVLLEALAAGVPVVTTSCSPAVREIVAHRSFGAVVPAEPEVLAAALRDVVDGPRPDGAALGRLLDRHRAGQSAAAWLSLLDVVVAARAA